MKKILFTFIYFLIAACYITFPLALNMTSALPHTGDELLITWILNWNIHSLFTDPLGIFHTNTFYPYQNTLAYSDAFFSSSLIGVLPWIFFQQPAAAYNFNLILSFALLGFSTYLLVHYITKAHLPGIISGTLTAFSTYIITKTMHLQLVSTFWIPLCLLFFFRYTKTKKTRDILLCYLFFFFQALNSFQPTYFLAISLVFLWIYFYFSDRKKFLLFLNKKVILYGVFTAILIALIAFPYFSVSHQFNYTRDIRDAIHFANRIEYTFYPSGRTRLYQPILDTLYKNDTQPFKYDGYIGLAFFVLFFFSVIYFFAKVKHIQYFKPFLILGFFGFVMSLGPALQWGGQVIKLPFIIPLPYAIFYYIVPGFNGMRNSARWELLFLFASSVTIGLICNELFKKKLKPWAGALTFGICLLVFAEVSFPMSLAMLPKKEEFPKTNYFLSSLPHSSIVIEMPAYVWYMAPYATEELYREYYSTIDFKKRVNGGSGFSPIPWEKQISKLLSTFPDDKSIFMLKHLGVSHIIVHGEEYDQLVKDMYTVENKRIRSRGEIVAMLSQNKHVSLVKKIDSDYVYIIHR